VGWNTDYIDYSYSNYIVIGKRNVGGLIGLNYGTITKSYSTGSTTGENNTGGLIGGNIGYVYDSYSKGTVNGNKSVGGLIGWSRGQVNKSYAMGNTSGELYVGGLVGHNYYFSSSIINSYSTGNIFGREYTGGLAGWNDRGYIYGSFANGDVNGVDYTGGLVGWNRGDIYDTYSIGTVIGEQNIGGLTARNTGTIINSFWDIETSGTLSSHGGTGLNTTEMKTRSTFTSVGWDFNNTWHMIEEITYPLLIWQELPQLTSRSLDLKYQSNSDGWNFVSLYLKPKDTNLEFILADIYGSYNQIMYFDSSTDSWKSFVPNRSSHFNDLNSWDRTMGIWIQMNENTTLNIDGYVPTRTDITLYPGWNMVGLPSYTDGNHDLPEEVTKIGYFEASTEYNLSYDHYPESFIFESGKGYWIYNGMYYSVTWSIYY